MKSKNTNPRISSAILASLHQWNHNEQPTLSPISPQIQAALLEQNQIGWFNFLLGRHSRHWEHAQQAWILTQAQNERISSSRRWAASLINKTWLISWDMWEHRNRILHSPLHPRQVAKVAPVDSRITEEYETGIEGLLSQDRKLFRKPITTLFKYPLGHKVQWLESVSFARDRPARSSTSNSQQAERRLMRQWLHPMISPVVTQIPDDSPDPTVALLTGNEER